MLPEIVEAKRGHCRLPLVFEKTAGWRPSQEAAPALAALRPPERFFGFASDVAPRKSNVVQVTIGPPCQFKPLATALTPDMKRFTELGEKPRFMMISHRLLGTSGHRNLLKLTYDPQYRSYLGFRQTTL